MLVILKIPIVYLCAVVWWAIRAEPELEQGGGTAETAPHPWRPWHSWRRSRDATPPRRPARLADPGLRRARPARRPHTTTSERRDDQAVTSYSEDPDRTGQGLACDRLLRAGDRAGGVGIAILPALLTPAAVVLALAAVLDRATTPRAFTAAAAAFAGLAWITGMTLALFTHHSLF